MSQAAITFVPSSSYHEALARTAAAFGIEREYWDIWGHHHEASADTQKAILASLGVKPDTIESLDAAVEQLLWEDWSRMLRPVLVVSEGDPRIAVTVPASLSGVSIKLGIRDEDGTLRHQWHWLPELPQTGEAELRGVRFLRKTLVLPPLGLGYYDLQVTVMGNSPDPLHASSRLAVCPERAFCPPELEAGKTAGVAVSLYGLRSGRNWGCGDFTDLAALIDWAAGEARAGFIALNPLHAIPNRQPFNTSPYLPTCIYYRNLLYIDVERIPDFAGCARARRLLGSPAIQEEIAALREAGLVAYERVHRLKKRFLKLCFRQFLCEYRAKTGRALEFRRWAEEEGERLQDFATYCALEEDIHRRSPQIWLWTGWPEAYRDPRSEATRAFAREHWRSVMFYQYVQWQLDLQLAETQEYARARGLLIGLYHDLALATDRFGADLWAHRPFYVAGCRVGSPPDGFSPKGQDWSFPPPDARRHRADGYRLFAESIRKNCRHGGALRIDHVMRFFRLFWIPDRMEAIDGTYVRDYPEDLLRILALESVRRKVAVIGEDLGTVTDDVRHTLARFGIFSYRLFYFERHAGGGFKLPSEYPRQALVAATTHDLPTLAGFWSGRDVEARRAAGLLPDEATYRRLLDDRAAEKQNMLNALRALQLLPPGFPESAANAPEFTGGLRHAVIGFLASTPSTFLVVNQEDLTGETEQQNLPGTTAEHPNWQRKMRFSVEELRSAPQAREFTAMFRRWLEATGRVPNA